MIPPHIRAAIKRDAKNWVTTDGVPALVAMGLEDNPFRLCGECDNYLTLEQYPIGYCDDCNTRLRGDL